MKFLSIIEPSHKSRQFKIHWFKYSKREETSLKFEMLMKALLALELEEDSCLLN